MVPTTAKGVVLEKSVSGGRGGHGQGDNRWGYHGLAPRTDRCLVLLHKHQRKTILLRQAACQALELDNPYYLRLTVASLARGDEPLFSFRPRSSHGSVRHDTLVKYITCVRNARVGRLVAEILCDIFSSPLPCPKFGTITLVILLPVRASPNKTL